MQYEVRSVLHTDQLILNAGGFISEGSIFLHADIGDLSFPWHGRTHGGIGVRINLRKTLKGALAR